LIAVWPVQSLKMALRLHHEVPGIEVPEGMLRDMEAAGPDASRVGRERALTLFREAPDYAAGVYLIAPFKKPENVIPLIDEAMGYRFVPDAEK
jgi:homocysteine S-methyltransferase